MKLLAILMMISSVMASAGELVEFISCSTAPNPFSPAVAGQATITSNWNVKNIAPDIVNQSVDIRTYFRVTTTLTNGAGTEVRSFMTQVSASKDASATGESQPVIQHSWNGKSADGVVVPDGTYSVSFAGSIVQVIQNKKVAQGGQQITEVTKATVTAANSIVVDSTAPEISDLNPRDGIAVNNPRPTISAKIADALSGVDATSISLFIDDIQVPVSATENGFSYTPATNLTDGKHSIVVRVRDNAGNAGVAKR